MKIPYYETPLKEYVDVDIENIAFAYLCSGALYISGLICIQRTLAKIRISTGSGRLGSISSAIAIGVNYSVCSLIFSNVVYISSLKSTSKSSNIYHFCVPIHLDWKEKLILFIMGILIHKFVFRSKFTSILASHCCYAGAFSEETARIPTKPFKKANDLNKKKIRALAEKYGCHMCGTKSGFMVADHIPPSSIIDPSKYKGTQYLYPHCISCSYKQSIEVNRTRNPLITHTKFIRKIHLFIPAFIVIIPLVRYVSKKYF